MTGLPCRELGSCRGSQIKTLPVFHAKPPEGIKIFPRLNPFRDHFSVQVFGDLENPPECFFDLSVPRDSPDISFVQLDNVWFKENKVFKASVPKSDVVDRDGNTGPFKSFYGVNQVGRIPEDLLFADFKTVTFGGTADGEFFNDFVGRNINDCRGEKVDVPVKLGGEGSGGRNTGAETIMIDEREHVLFSRDPEKIIRHHDGAVVQTAQKFITYNGKIRQIQDGLFEREKICSPAEDGGELLSVGGDFGVGAANFLFIQGDAIFPFVCSDGAKDS